MRWNLSCRVDKLSASGRRMTVFWCLREWEHVKFIGGYATTSDPSLQTTMMYDVGRQGIRRLTWDPEEINDTVWRQWKTVFCKKEGEATLQFWDGRISGQVWRIRASVSNHSPSNHERTAAGDDSPVGRPGQGGTDGWRRVEWKQLTPDMLEHLAELHTCIEEKAVALSWRELSQVDAWPEDALFAPVATIPKDDNCQPNLSDLCVVGINSFS